jgi:hypothetical protein
VNSRFFGPVDPDGFDALAEDLRAGRLDETVPAHGILSRVERSVGLPARDARAQSAAAGQRGPTKAGGTVAR